MLESPPVRMSAACHSVQNVERGSVVLSAYGSKLPPNHQNQYLQRVVLDGLRQI